MKKFGQNLISGINALGLVYIPLVVYCMYKFIEEYNVSNELLVEGELFQKIVFVFAMIAVCLLSLTIKTIQIDCKASDNNKLARENNKLSRENGSMLDIIYEAIIDAEDVVKDAIEKHGTDSVKAKIKDGE